MGAVDSFARYLTVEGLPRDVEQIRREHVEGFISDQLARFKPATANNRYRGLLRFLSGYWKRKRSNALRWRRRARHLFLSRLFP
jgi:hypothetical protein